VLASTSALAVAEAASVTEVLPPATARRSRVKISIAATTLLIVAIGLFLFARSRTLSVFSLLKGDQPTVTPLTGSLGHEFRPQFSPDGKQIVFSWAGPEDKGADVYVKLLDAGAPVRITEPMPNGGHFSAVWSPDGSFVASVRVYRKPDDPALKPAEPPKSKLEQPGDNIVMPAPPDIGIYVMPAMGGPERRVATVTSFGGFSWSPDGEWLAISDGERFVANAIYLVSVKTSERKQLTKPPAGYKGDYSPEFSRDGRSVAFSRNLRNGADDIFIVPVTGGEPRRVTNEWQPIKGLTFSESGSEIIYAAGWKGGGNSFLWRVSVAGGASRRVEIAGDGASDPNIARTGHRLAFTQGVSATNIWQYEIPAQPGKYASGKVLLGSTRQQAGGDFSPDGTRIVYASNRSGNWEIWSCQRDGSKPVQLTNFGGPQTGTPRWSPDGKHIAFD